MADSAENDAGPEDGHTFRFRFDIRGSSKVVGEPAHTDAPDFMGPVHEIRVRAWNLRDALRKAADLPFGVLMGNLVGDDPLPDASTPPVEPVWIDCTCGHPNDGHDMYGCFPACGCTVPGPAPTRPTPPGGDETVPCVCGAQRVRPYPNDTGDHSTTECPIPPAFCLCGHVDDRGDGTCGNCGLRIMTEDDETSVFSPGREDS